MDTDSRIYVAGHSGLVGSAIVRALQAAGFDNLITASHQDVDLIETKQVAHFIGESRPEYLFLAAARVGGILANESAPVDFLYENLMIEANVIRSAYENKVKKLLFLGSTCIYPKFAPQPLKEEYLLSGPLESTNQWYAVAKIAGIKLCQAYRKQYGADFIAAMPTNLYGPNDNFDLASSHVLPALIRKFYEAKTAAATNVEIWGSGQPRREFLHVDDCAEACLFLMEHYDGAEHVNIGTGRDISIHDLALLIKGIVGFEGDLQFDRSKPDGTPRKVVDTSKINRLGWQARRSLEDGLQSTYQWYLENEAQR